MLQAENLTCRRGRRFLFRHLDFALRAGDLLLVTGANGSGKSSLLRIMAGLLPPAEGRLLWSGEDIATGSAAHRERLHYIGHLDAVKPELTADEMIDYWAALLNRSLSSRGERESFLQPLGLQGLSDTPVRYFSAGQRRRLALARLLLSDAPLWLLDEPTTALDREGQALLAGLVARHREKGGVAVIATHHEADFAGAQVLKMGAA